jgi:ATP-dependent phosphoenolpyruvate carboxykinase
MQINTFNLKDQDIHVHQVYRNLPPSLLYEHAIRYEKDASIAENGALVAYSGAKTGRSPQDKRIVKHPASENDIWWAKINIPCAERSRITTKASRVPAWIIPTDEELMIARHTMRALGAKHATEKEILS